MDWLTRLERLSHNQLKNLAFLCGGVAVLMIVALTLSGNLPFVPTFTIALQPNSSQAAALAVGDLIQTFPYSGGDQSITIPPGVFAIKVKMWGAAGGGTGGGTSGGGGGYAEGVALVTPGNTYKVIVGQGGVAGGGRTYGGGGSASASGGSGGGRSAFCSSGGGASALCSATELVTAGGGGGGDYYSFSPPWYYGYGGAGGGSNGQASNPDLYPPFNPGYIGTGGTQAGPGYYTTGGFCPGAQFSGGNAFGNWAGGGSGWFGGGCGLGGGGGSGHCDASVLNCSLTTGSLPTSGNSVDPDLPSGAAQGGVAGGNGFVEVFVAAPPGPPPPPPLPNPPTMSITGEDTTLGSGPLTGQVAANIGDLVDISATFSADATNFDSLFTTAINNNADNDWCGTGCTPTPAGNPSNWYDTPLNSKSYTFDTTTLAPGSYLFRPAARTNLRMAAKGWENPFNKQIFVVVCDSSHHAVGGSCVANVCAGPNQDPSTGCTTCLGGFHDSPSPGLDCVPNTCANNATDYPTCVVCPGPNQDSSNSCLCSSGFHDTDPGPAEICVPDVLPTCLGPHEDQANSCNCIPPYQRVPSVGGTCQVKPTIVTFTPDQSKVRSGFKPSFTWMVTGLVIGESTNCIITSNPPGVFSRSMPNDVSGHNIATTWSATRVMTDTAITKTTSFTLSCTNANSQTRTVGIIPAVIEI